MMRSHLMLQRPLSDGDGQGNNRDLDDDNDNITLMTFVPWWRHAQWATEVSMDRVFDSFYGHWEHDY